ncbi:exopolysaccharide biosynthesis polyprenyl glycosylphosphotransferase [Streptomyces sp. CA-210063]|uniref:exopolysaccharide biosynthesis polyprenyl glycosylphosphotransferase n=1 Tax=Streptomyces sp. CA-210063 TaxID=2801029 RepID=UPI00214C1557|nr:exopolysaccharide biosynthesis polyprenyl glycosylphosphotransferase [Streptomyces sp. CA-210063]UUU33853.1 exopolysaccharide biosynthesis polyprenyl glycosylphosphotransferase [Streptomyces sp. CA-210063]
MTAESTVPSPGGQAQGHGSSSVSSVSVITPRGADDGSGFPAARPAIRRHSSALALLAVDAGAALLVAQALTDARTPGHPLLVAGLLLAVVCLNARARLYRPPAVPAVLDELPAICARIVVCWCVLAAAVAAYSPDHSLSVDALALGCVLQSAASCAGRGTVHWQRRRALVRRPGAALVVGPAATAQRVAAAFLRRPGCGLRPVGVVADQAAGGEGLPVLATDEEVRRALVQNGVQTVLVVGSRTERGPLLRALAEAGCVLWQVDAESPSYDRSSERLAGFPCRRLELTPRYEGVGKRALDIVVSGTLLLLVSPLLLTTAVVLRLSDGPGVVFRQERIGRGGRPFTLLKFRTHRPADAHEAATRWSVANEQEMRWFCRFLRRTSLDELLQLWNVLRGDMSLVGPRPERPYFVGKFSQTYPGYTDRHRMRTGITGLAQIHGLRGDTSIEDRARFDNAYIDDWSLWQDVCVLLRTAAALVRPTGS